MQRQFLKSEFKPKALEIMRTVERTGESVVITDHGKPCLEVKPYTDPEESPLQKLRGSVVEFIDSFEAVADGEWESLY